MASISNIVLFTDQQQLKYAFIQAEKGNKFLAQDENGKQTKLADKQILLILSKQANSLEHLQDISNSLKKDAAMLRKTIDVSLLWEMLAEDESEMELLDIAELYFSDIADKEKIALLMLLVGDQIHFRSKNKLYAARSAEQVKALKEAEQKKIAKERLVKQASRFYRAVKTASKMIDVPEELERFMQEVEDFYFKNMKNDARILFTKIDPDEDALECAYVLLMKTGRLSPGSDDVLSLGRLKREFPKEAVEALNGLKAYDGADDREDFSDRISFSIDDPETREVDDVLSVRFYDDYTEVGIYIADAASYVIQDGAIDQEALRRGATLYMPQGAILMIPDQVSCDYASLNTESLKPCFAFILKFDNEFNLLEHRLALGKMRVHHRLSYEEADEIIENGGELADALRYLDQLAKARLQQRLGQGAMIIQRVETKVRVKEGRANVQAIPPGTAARDLVGECMILANYITAKVADEKDIPLSYRSQPKPDDPARKYLGQIVNEHTPNVFRGMKKSQLSLSAKPHTGLGLSHYTQITSPLRRYGDLVMQRQLSAWLKGEELPYTVQGLMEVIGNAEFTERENRKLERISTRFWEIQYLADQDPAKEYDAIIVGKNPNAVQVSIQPWGIRGKIPIQEKISMGAMIQVKAKKLDPQFNIARFEQIV